MRNKIDTIITLIPTDLPDPVVPAIKRCGISSKLENTGIPLISLPIANTRFFWLEINFSFLNNSLR